MTASHSKKAARLRRLGRFANSMRAIDHDCDEENTRLAAGSAAGGVRVLPREPGRKKAPPLRTALGLARTGRDPPPQRRRVDFTRMGMGCSTGCGARAETSRAAAARAAFASAVPKAAGFFCAGTPDASLVSSMNAFEMRWGRTTGFASRFRTAHRSTLLHKNSGEDLASICRKEEPEPITWRY